MFPAKGFPSGFPYLLHLLEANKQNMIFKQIRTKILLATRVSNVCQNIVCPGLKLQPYQEI